MKNAFGHLFRNLSKGIFQNNKIILFWNFEQSFLNSLIDQVCIKVHAIEICFMKTVLHHNPFNDIRELLFYRDLLEPYIMILRSESDQREFALLCKFGKWVT